MKVIIFFGVKCVKKLYKRPKTSDSETTKDEDKKIKKLLTFLKKSKCAYPIYHYAVRHPLYLHICNNMNTNDQHVDAS